ncbi:MAG: GNAT superfamily N-acetyltransferase [Flavobacteriales bacterium]|jgi:GNAT superfamily N-acetyltransferase
MIDIIHVDYNNTAQAADLINMLNAYALDPMGGGEELAEETKSRLVQELSKRNDAISLIAYTDGKAIALINAFEGFSSFAAKPLINVHDVFVAKEHRGTGIVYKMMEELGRIALERGCCKLTLEVLSKNDRAKKAYLTMGYKPYDLGEDGGHAEFWQMPL